MANNVVKVSVGVQMCVGVGVGVGEGLDEGLDEGGSPNNNDLRRFPGVKQATTLHKIITQGCR